MDDVYRTRKPHMKAIHWFSLGMLILGVALLFMGLSTAGTVALVVPMVVELVHAAWTGKQANGGMH